MPELGGNFFPARRLPGMRVLAQKQSLPLQESPLQGPSLRANAAVVAQPAPAGAFWQPTLEAERAPRAGTADADAHSADRGNLRRNTSDFSLILVHLTPRPILQTKLMVNSPGDVYEQEAERVAEQVMRMPGPIASTPSQSSASVARVQRECVCGGSCSEYRKRKSENKFMNLQMKSLRASESALEAPPIVHQVLRSPGQPLGAQTRAFMEPRFGYDFSGVRVHSDPHAERSAQAVHARAYTVGQDVVFGSGQFMPATPIGRSLLAHELTHVVQQVSGHLSGAEKSLQREPDQDSDRNSKTATKSVCGPDVTQWFIDTVSAAKKDKAVLQIQQNFADANAIMKYLGLPDIRLLAEYFVDEKVTAAWESAGKPPEKGEAKGQRLSAASGFFAMKQAEQKVLSFDDYELALLVRAKNLTRDAADIWISLVQDGARYDFKNSARALGNPHSKNCPKECKGTLTLCDMCFKTYVPGDLFYAHVGRFVGWSDLALRLEI